MKSKSIFAAAMLATALISCNKEGDTTKPVIDVKNLSGEQIAFKPKGTICVEMDLSDNEALESFEINIHNAFDGHEHGHAKASIKHEEHHDWCDLDATNKFKFNATSKDAAYIGEYDISGQKNAYIDFDITIDESVAYGNYHLLIYCFDAEGNESHVARSFQITEDGNYFVHEDE